MAAKMSRIHHDGTASSPLRSKSPTPNQVKKRLMMKRTFAAAAA